MRRYESIVQQYIAKVQAVAGCLKRVFLLSLPSSVNSSFRNSHAPEWPFSCLSMRYAQTRPRRRSSGHRGDACSLRLGSSPGTTRFHGFPLFLFVVPLPRLAFQSLNSFAAHHSGRLESSILPTIHHVPIPHHHDPPSPGRLARFSLF